MRFRLMVGVCSVLAQCHIGICQAGGKEENVPETAWGKEVHGFRLSVVTDKQHYISGEAVFCTVRLKNLTDESKELPVEFIGNIYRFTVLFPDGNPVPLTLKGKRLLGDGGPQAGSGTSRPVEPGDCRVVNVSQLNRLYDMTLEGEYRISVSTRVPKSDDTGWTRIASNVAKMTIKEPADGDGISWGWESFQKREPQSAVEESPGIQDDSNLRAKQGLHSRAQQKAGSARPADSLSSWPFAIVGLAAGTGLGALLVWAFLRKRYAGT